MHMRIYYTKQGGHIHCRVFTAKAKNFTHALAGTLVFNEDEWTTVFDMLNPIAEMIEEVPDEK